MSPEPMNIADEIHRLVTLSPEVRERIAERMKPEWEDGLIRRGDVLSAIRAEISTSAKLSGMVRGEVQRFLFSALRRVADVEENPSDHP